MTIEVWFHDQRGPGVLWGRFEVDGDTVATAFVSPRYRAAVEDGVYSPALERPATPKDGAAFIDALKSAYRRSTSMELRIAE